MDNYLQKWKSTLLVVSHDQDFLSSVCDTIIHLNMKKLDYYKGDYYTFKKMEAQKRAEALKAYNKQVKEIKRAKAAGKTKEAAEKAATSKREKEAGKKGKKGGMGEFTEEQEAATQLLERPKEYVVEFSFPPVCCGVVCDVCSAPP